jgi:hypothetical protein
VQSLFSVIEIEGSAGKGCCEKLFKLCGTGFGEAQNVDALVQLTESPSCISIAAICGRQLMRLSAVVLKLMSSM